MYSNMCTAYQLRSSGFESATNEHQASELYAKSQRTHYWYTYASSCATKLLVIKQSLVLVEPAVHHRHHKNTQSDLILSRSVSLTLSQPISLRFIHVFVSLVMCPIRFYKKTCYAFIVSHVPPFFMQPQKLWILSLCDLSSGMKAF